MSHKWNIRHKKLIVFILIASIIISFILSDVSFAAIEDTVKKNCQVDYYYYDSSNKQIVVYTTLDSSAGAGKKKIIYNETSDDDGTYYEISNEDARDAKCSYPMYIYQDSTGKWVAHYEDSSTQEEIDDIGLTYRASSDRSGQSDDLTGKSNTSNSGTTNQGTTTQNGGTGTPNSGSNSGTNASGNTSSSIYYYIPTGQDPSKIDNFTYIVYDQSAKTLVENILDHDESKNRTNNYTYSTTSDDGYDVFLPAGRRTGTFY